MKSARSAHIILELGHMPHMLLPRRLWGAKRNDRQSRWIPITLVNHQHFNNAAFRSKMSEYMLKDSWPNRSITTDRRLRYYGAILQTACYAGKVYAEPLLGLNMLQIAQLIEVFQDRPTNKNKKSLMRRARKVLETLRGLLVQHEANLAWLSTEQMAANRFLDCVGKDEGSSPGGKVGEFVGPKTLLLDEAAMVTELRSHLTSVLGEMDQFKASDVPKRAAIKYIAGPPIRMNDSDSESADSDSDSDSDD